MIIKQIVIYIFSNFAQQFLGLLTSFGIRRFIIPSDFGVWVTINMIMSYCSYTNLGIFSAVYKEIPYHIGKKDLKTADSIKNLSGTFIMATGLAVSIVLFITSLFLNSAPSLSIGLKVVSIMVFLTFIFSFYITLFRAYNDFVSLSKVILINSVVIFLVYISFSYFWHLYGLYIAAILSLVIIIVYTLIHRKEIVGFRFVTSFKEFKKIVFLLKIGIALLLVGFCFTLLLTAEKWVIINKLGFTQMGYYSIAIMFYEGVGQISQLVAHITFSKIQNLYGEMGDSAAFSNSVKKYLSKLTLDTAYVIPVVIGLIYIWGNFLVVQFIPKYIPGIASMNILIIGGLFIGLSHFSNNFLLTLNKYMLTIPMFIGSTAVVFLASLFFVSKGMGIAGIAIAATLGYFLFFLIISWTALRYIHPPKEIVVLYTKIALVLTYYAILIFACKSIKFAQPLFSMTAQTGLFLIGALPAVLKFNKETGIFKNIFKK